MQQEGGCVVLNQDDIDQLRNEYDSRKGLFNQLIETTKFIISQEIQNIKIHSFNHRIKGFDSFVEKNFEIIEKDDKIDGVDVNIFGYMVLKYKAKLKDVQSDYKDFKDIPFEIQIITIAQDAWASISHYLDYKNENKLPLHLKRDFHALSGLFYVADTHFEILRQEVTKHYLSES